MVDFLHMLKMFPDAKMRSGLSPFIYLLCVLFADDTNIFLSGKDPTCRLVKIVYMTACQQINTEYIKHSFHGVPQSKT